MNDPLNFDTLDILAAAMGAGFAFSLLSLPADRGTERIVVGLSVLATVTLKRYFIKTKPANPNSKAGFRMAYLFIALVGTVCVGLPLIAVLADFTNEFQEGIIEVMFCSGLALLLIATYIDRRLLKLP